MASLKERLFATGASALSRISRYSNLYGCPICTRLLPAEALQSGELTLEHVPPRALGGRGIALTCKSCNTEAGSMVDAAVHGRRRLRPSSKNLSLPCTGVARESSPAQSRLRQAGVVTNAMLLTKDGQVTLIV
jgi:hypothetical protein